MQPTVTTRTATAAPAPEPKSQPRRKLHLKFQSPLTPTEEVALTSRNYDQTSRNRLVETFLPLVEEIARYYANFGRDVDELISEGNLALCEASVQYNYLSCLPFRDYAADRVRKAIYRLFGVDGASPRTPAAVRTELRKLDEVELQLYHQLGHRPTNAEIAPYLAATAAYVGELRLLKRKLDSLNRTAKVDSEGSDLIELIPDTGYTYRDEGKDTVDPAEVDILLQRDVLTEEERECLIHSYGLRGNPDLTYREVGKELGFSHTTVGNRVASAIKKLALVPRLRPTWVKVKPKYQSDDVQPVVKLDTCAECGKHVAGWGNRTFRDWWQYRQPAKETPAGTVPQLAACYRCSRTVAFAERIQRNLTARGAMLAASEAIRVNVWDYKSQKLVSLATYAPSKPVATTNIEHQPLHCCYCPTIISADTLGDVVVKEVDQQGRYQLIGCCRICYAKIGNKWEQGKRDKRLVREPQPQAAAAKPKRKRQGKTRDRIAEISRYWQAEARKLAIPPQPLSKAPMLDDWDYGWRTNTILDPLGQSLGCYTNPTFKLSRRDRQALRQAEFDELIATLPDNVRHDLAAKRRLEAARAEQLQLYRQLLHDEEMQVTAAVALACDGTFSAQVLAYRFLARVGGGFITDDWRREQAVLRNGRDIQPPAATSRLAKCNKCRNVTNLRRLNLGARTNRFGIAYHYAIGLCAACWPKSPTEVGRLQVQAR